MIPLQWLPLAGGLAVTSAVIAWEDFRMQSLYLHSFYPAIIGIAWFYSGALSLNLLVPVFGVLAAVLLSSYIVLWVFSAKVGRGDYLTIALFAFWPWMMVLSATTALAVGIVGHKLKWWNRGLRAIPLAGLMGLFALVFIGGMVL